LKVLLTGRNGQVGSELIQGLQAFGEVIATDRSTLDLADPDAIRRVVRDTSPHVIVNAAGYTAVDKAEEERELATRINARAPGILGEEAKRLNAILVHYSTDYVFDGAKGSPYTEQDAPHPLSHYGDTKLAGERAVAASGCRYLTLRTSWVYGPRASNFYQIIRRKAESHEPMMMVDDQTSVPTTALFVAAYTVKLLARGATGLLHLVPSGQASRYEFAREVVRRAGSRATVKAANSDSFPSAARRPRYSALNNAKLAGFLNVRPPDWRELLAAL
jgi:dTDP-4-dehydrorhamnose reductase